MSVNSRMLEKFIKNTPITLSRFGKEIEEVKSKISAVEDAIREVEKAMDDISAKELGNSGIYVAVIDVEERYYPWRVEKVKKLNVRKIDYEKDVKVPRVVKVYGKSKKAIKEIAEKYVELVNKRNSLREKENKLHNEFYRVKTQIEAALAEGNKNKAMELTRDLFPDMFEEVENG